MKCLMFVRPQNKIGSLFGISIIRQNRDGRYLNSGQFLLYWLLPDFKLQTDLVISNIIWKYRINRLRIERWF